MFVGAAAVAAFAAAAAVAAFAAPAALVGKSLVPDDSALDCFPVAEL